MTAYPRAGERSARVEGPWRVGSRRDLRFLRAWMAASGLLQGAPNGGNSWGAIRCAHNYCFVTLRRQKGRQCKLSYELRASSGELRATTADYQRRRTAVPPDRGADILVGGSRPREGSFRAPTALRDKNVALPVRRKCSRSRSGFVQAPWQLGRSKDRKALFLGGHGNFFSCDLGYSTPKGREPESQVYQGLPALEPGLRLC